MAAKILQDGVKVQTAAGADALTVDGSTGAATVGPSGFQGTHTLRGNTLTKKDVPEHRFESSGGVNKYCIGANVSDSVNDGFIFVSGESIPTGTAVGSFSSAGAWKLGPTAATGTTATLHSIEANGACTLQVKAANAANQNASLTLVCPGSNAGALTYNRANSRLYASSGTDLSGPYVASGGTSWTTGSDARLKNIVSEPVQGLSVVVSLNPVKYTRKAVENDSPHLGFIAQEVLPLIPEVVVGNGSEEDMYGLDYAALTPVLVKAIQEQQAMIEELKAKVAALEAK